MFGKALPGAHAPQVPSHRVVTGNLVISAVVIAGLVS
jgi:hypothetical protein